MNHIEFNTRTHVWEDKITAERFTEGEPIMTAKLGQEPMSFEGFTSCWDPLKNEPEVAGEVAHWMRRRANVIVLNPAYLNGQMKAGWPRFGSERIQLAAKPGFQAKVKDFMGKISSASWIKIKGGKEAWSPFDLLATYDMILLHEASIVRKPRLFCPMLITCLVARTHERWGLLYRRAARPKLFVEECGRGSRTPKCW